MPVSDPTWQFVLADGKTDATLADITHAVTATISPRISRPLTLTLKASQANSALFYTNGLDGNYGLSPGDRIVKAYRNGVLKANTEVWRCDWQGDENKQSVEITCYDSMVRSSGRIVTDSIGRIDAWQFVDPSTYSTSPSLPAGSTIQQLFQHSHIYDDLIDPGFDPARVFPVDYSSGDFSAAANIFDLFADGPLDLGTFVYTTVADTGVCDVVLTPTETSLGAAAGITGILNVVDQWGEDKSSGVDAVHFDYDMGDKSVAKVSRSIDMANVANFLRYLLGPKSNRPDHWAGSIDTDGSPTQLIDDVMASRARYGVFRVIKAYDSDPANTVRWLFRALYNTEQTLRVGPRELVAVTPSAACVFKPWDDYDIGDIVQINLGRSVGPPTHSTPRAQQRVYGFDVDVGVNGVEQVSTIYNSADAIQTTVGAA